MNNVEKCEGQVEKLLPGGDALLRVDGKSVLVLNGVPGDLLAVNIEGKRRGVVRATIEAVLAPSDQRINALCPVAESCGGCALQYISSAEQAGVKSAWVADAFNSLMISGVDWMPAEPAGNHMRRRLRWFVGSDEKGLFLGFYAPATHQAIRHDSCMVTTLELNSVRELIEQQVHLETIESVQAVQLDDGIHVVLESDVCPVTIDVDQLDGLALQWWWRDANRITRPLQKPKKIFHDLLPAGGAEVSLSVGPDDFVQGQRAGNQMLIRQIQEWAGPVHRIADLFCGIGNLSLPLAAATGAEVFGAELNPASVRAASKNAKALGIPSQFVVANLFEEFDKEPYIGADVLILDPPRRGAKRISHQMGELLPKKIIMVSCDAAAGARDGSLLQQQGYRLKALRALDLFPFAGHVEAMSLWQLG